MCGRFVSTATPAQLASFLHVQEIRTAALEPSWNVAPTDQVYAAADNREERRVLGTFRWGLVPYWARDDKVGARMINARAESLESKFRRTFERRRCLVPADGFYEWEKTAKGTKQPWFVQRADGAPMVFAGLWERWTPADAPGDADPLRTCSIVTTVANSLLARIHHRMPVVLSPKDWERWLDRALTDTSMLRDLLAPADARAFDLVKVSTDVNSVGNNHAGLVHPVDGR